MEKARHDAVVGAPKARAFLVLAMSLLLMGPLWAQETPMWEGVDKTEQQLKADADFIDAAKRGADDGIDLALRRGLQLGWQFIQQNDAEMAIRRFNQAWLLNPDSADVHWGFAVATALQGHDLTVVERHFARAHEIRSDDPYLLADHGRILQQRGESQRAIEYFEAALALNPDHRDAHVGMFYAHQALGNSTKAQDHLELAN